MKRIPLLLCLLLCSQSFAQRLEIVSGRSEQARAARHYLRGMTDPDARITVNGRPFKVYPTGAFAAEVVLEQGLNTVTVTAERNGEQRQERFDIRYEAPRPELPVEGFAIERVALVPALDRAVMAGDVLQVRMKATPGCRASWFDGVPLYELPADEAGVEGIYQGSYTVRENDPGLGQPVEVILQRGDEVVVRPLAECIEQLAAPVMLRTKGELPYLNYGLGTDRLGGSKIGHLVPGIVLEAVGKAGNMYQVRLSDHYRAWIPESCVEAAPEGAFRPRSLVGSWSVTGSGDCDVVRIGLQEKLPFRSFHQTDPSRVVIDLYGAVTNTAWITQYPERLGEIERVDYEQIEDDILRVIITLRHRQHWGHSIAYNGTALVVRIEHQPDLTLRGLHVAIDAGHGGSSLGAVGTTGAREKDINLALAGMLRRELEKRGAKVTLTRSEDRDVSMNERILLLRRARPDLLVSIHCNAGGSPFTGKGTSTYYRHIGFRPLSTAILDELLTLGVNNFGNIGSFNFALSSPTEYPNVLVETLFMSSPEDEARLLDERFRQQMIDKIVRGLQRFLKEAGRR